MFVGKCCPKVVKIAQATRILREEKNKSSTYRTLVNLSKARSCKPPSPILAQHSKVTGSVCHLVWLVRYRIRRGLSQTSLTLTDGARNFDWPRNGGNFDPRHLAPQPLWQSGLPHPLSHSAALARVTGHHSVTQSGGILICIGILAPSEFLFSAGSVLRWC